MDIPVHELLPPLPPPPLPLVMQSEELVEPVDAVVGEEEGQLVHGRP